MEKNSDIYYDTYYNNLKEKAVSIQLKTAEQSQSLRKTCLGLCSPPRLTSKLQDDYAAAVKISKLSLSVEDDESFVILRRIYKFLVSSQEQPNKRDVNWQLIGFQGENPATDLRAAGLLSLVHLLFFFEHYPNYFRSIYLFGNSEQGSFPFAILGINISKLVLDCMREGVLNKEFNKRKDVNVVMHLFYQGLWHYLVEILKKAKVPNKIMEFHRTFQAVETFARVSPSKILGNYEKFIFAYDRTLTSDMQSENILESKPYQPSMEVGLTDITLEPDIKTKQLNIVPDDPSEQAIHQKQD